MRVNQKINSTLAFMFVLVLGFLVVWYSVTTGEEIIKNAQEGAVFNAHKSDIEKELRR